MLFIILLGLEVIVFRVIDADREFPSGLFFGWNLFSCRINKYISGH
jgi:hypothetical protein